MELSQLKIRVKNRMCSYTLHRCKKLQVVRIAKSGDLGEISISRIKVSVILSQEQSRWFIQRLRTMQINPCYGKKIFQLRVAGRVVFVAGLRQVQEKLIF